jgi:hypothetical protein
VFEHIREALRDLWRGSSTPEERRDALHQMRETLVRARLGLDDLRAGISATRVQLGAANQELATVRRRKALAAGINDAETVTVAERFERQYAEKVDVLERKLSAQEAELQLVEREVEEMTAEFKAAHAGVGSSPLSGGAAARAAMAEADAAAGNDEGLRQDLDALGREQARAAREADADERLAELKRRMGR